jgi:hypothetical protein
MELREDGKSRGRSIPDEVSNLPTKARMMWFQLGKWASSYFLTSIRHHIAGQTAGQNNSFSPWWPSTRYLNLMTVLRNISEVQLQAPGNTSNKVERMLLFLNRKACENFSGIIFVRERATAYVLSVLLNKHPLTHGLFRCSPCVSNSSRSEPWATYDSLISRRSDEVVDEFRCGKINLIIATNVLEEGIDLPACHLVISFEVPDNITSYIQRRGRARHIVSEFVVMEEDDGVSLASHQWNELEKKMAEICLDHHENRQILDIDDGKPEETVLQLCLHTGSVSSFMVSDPLANIS